MMAADGTMVDLSETEDRRCFVYMYMSIFAGISEGLFVDHYEAQG